ncbi:hypothetical protein [Methanothrix sp.]|jgi:hypothetical protein
MLKEEGAIDEKELIEISEGEKPSPSYGFCDLGARARSALERLKRSFAK